MCVSYRAIQDRLLVGNNWITDFELNARRIVCFKVFKTLLEVNLAACRQDIFSLLGCVKLDARVSASHLGQSSDKLICLCQQLGLNCDLNQALRESGELRKVGAVKCRRDSTSLE